MESYLNKFHNNNVYIKIKNLEQIKREDFNLISSKYLRPIQIGLNSDQKSTIKFLLKSGFILKRKIYEYNITKDNLIKDLDFNRLILDESIRCNPIYDKAALIFYEYYKKIHKSINVLSVGFKDFKEMLTDTLIYTKGLKSFAFIDKAEIAYIYDENQSIDFSINLLNYLFKDYTEVTFEVDNLDPSAMALVSIFDKDPSAIFETYLRYPSYKGSYIILSSDSNPSLYQCSKETEGKLYELIDDFLKEKKTNTYTEKDFIAYLENKKGAHLNFVREIQGYITGRKLYDEDGLVFLYSHIKAFNF